MGSTHGPVIEQPVHEVTLDAFYMGKYEVTFGEFKSFRESPEYKELRLVEGSTYSWHDNALFYGSHDGRWQQHDWRNSGENSPVSGVTWFLAIHYCNWLSKQEGLTPVYRQAGEDWQPDPAANGYRLPTESEWEYACRAGTTTRYWWGDDFKSRHCNFADSNLFASFTGTYDTSPYLPETFGPLGGERDGFKEACSVDAGRIFENPWGLAHMSGNVLEWCQDELRGYVETGKAEGPVLAKHRVIRGGGWHSAAEQCSSSYRSWLSANRLASDVGFRLVLQIPR